MDTDITLDFSFCNHLPSSYVSLEDPFIMHFTSVSDGGTQSTCHVPGWTDNEYSNFINHSIQFFSSCW